MCSLQVAKNIVLAGVGTVTLVDNTLCGAGALYNFLVPAGADPAQRCVCSRRKQVSDLASSCHGQEALDDYLEALGHYLFTVQPMNLVCSAL